MKKKIVSIITSVMMLLTVFGFGSAITVSAVETEEVSPSTTGALIDIGYGNKNITATFRDGLGLNQWGESSSNYNYTGAAIQPKIDLIVCGFDSDNNWMEENLIKDVDYTITYPNNAIEPGEYFIEFTGIGAYTGNRSVQFNIIKDSEPTIPESKIDISQATVNYSPSLTYTGAPMKPVSSVIYGGKELKIADDYIVSPGTITDLGTHTITITGVGKYTGVIKKTVTVVEQAAKVDISKTEINYSSSLTYTGKSLSPISSVKYNGKTLTKGTDYDVVPEAITYPETYTINIIGKGNYTGIIQKTVTVVEPVDISSRATVSYNSSRAYTGTAVNPISSVKYGEKTLTKGTDYTVSPSSIKYPGTHTITITGKGAYKGTVKKSVTIKNPTFAATISSVSTSKSAPYVRYSTSIKGASKVTYKVLYKTSSSSAWKTAASATTSKKLKIKGLAGKKAYAVIVIPTATLNGKTYTGSAAVKYKGITKPSGTAITTSTDFTKKINANPKGKYYLVNNISLTAKSQITETFKGTLDGNGFTIKGFSYSGSNDYYVGIFHKADKATFKNLKITGVNMNVKRASGAVVGTVAASAWNCKFSNVKVYGKIIRKPSGTTSLYGASIYAGGIVGIGNKCKFTSCVNDIDITATCNNKYNGAAVGGIAATNGGGSISKCTNTANINVSGYSAAGFSMNAAGLVGGTVDTVSSCKNSGKISVTMGSKSGGINSSGAAGICGTVGKTIVSCKNTGAVSLKHSGTTRNLYAAGIVGNLTYSKGYMSKCSNKGAITFSGKQGGGEGAVIGGLAGNCAYATQCFNKGPVKATITNRGFGKVGGVCGIAYKITNNYNVGKVSLSGYGNVGGLAGSVNIFKKGGYYNYNAGTVYPSGGVKKEKFYGAIFGSHDGDAYNYTANYNYYKKGTSSRSYGVSPITNKYKAKAIKVSSITKKTCPKLSSKYWKYSSKYKRMVLKNNPEY